MLTATEEALAPAFPGWPERRERFVNVLCEGPSILEFDPSQLLPGPVVAINHALSLSDRVPIDFWATVDEPKVLWDWAQPHLHQDCKIFTTENNLAFWVETIGYEDGSRRLYAKEPSYMVETEHSPAFLGQNGHAALLPTVTHVLGWLYHLDADVRVFGADMRGSDSPLSIAPFSEDEDEGWQFRWDAERRLFALSTKKFRSRGKRLERWVPQSTSTKNR